VELNHALPATLLGVQPAATVNLGAGTVSPTGTATDLKMLYVGGTKLYRALVPPQTLASGKKLFRFFVGEKPYISSALTAQVTLAAGTASKHTITLPSTTIDLSTVSAGGTGYTYASNTVTITTDGLYILTGATTTKQVTVASGVTADIILDNASIGLSAGSTPFNMTGATVNLLLEGTNSLTTEIGDYTNTTPGLRAPGGTPNSVLVIGGSDTLTVSGRAGIGGDKDESCGNITINGGTINANGYDGAGIGSGRGYGGSINNSAGRITINGGTVKAKTTDWGAAIGGGQGSDGGTIIINGGMVTAENTNEGVAIGGGRGFNSINNIGSAGGTIIITGGTVIAKAAQKWAIGGGYGSNGNGADATITLPSAYRWWINTANNSDPGGAGTAFPGTAFSNSYDYKYVKIEVQ
jgi:hypothetical protein